MIDQDIVLAKAHKVEHHLRRIMKKREIGQDEFLADLDFQESILYNLQMAIQNCIDLAAHIISDEELGIASSTNEMFYISCMNMARLTLSRYITLLIMTSMIWSILSK